MLSSVETISSSVTLLDIMEVNLEEKLLDNAKTQSAISNVRPLNGNQQCRTDKSRVSHDTDDSQIVLDALVLDEDGEEADAYRNLPSAPHSTPLPVLASPRPRIDINVMVDTEAGDMSDSVAAISEHQGRRRPTPFSPSACSMNAYDQASESQHIAPPCVAPRRSRSSAATDTASVSSSSGGGGSDVNSLKTSPGGIANHHITNRPPVSAPWYQPHIPRELALEMLSRQPPGSFVVRDSGTHYNCYALSVRVGENSSSNVHSVSDRCLSADMALQPNHRSVATNNDCSGGTISHYLIQRTATGVRLKGLEKEWPSLSCLILHLTVMPEMLPCPLLDIPQSSSNPTAFLRNFEKAPDASAFRPISVGASGGGGASINSPPPSSPRPPPPPLHSVEYQQLSEFSSLLADLNTSPPPPLPPPHEADQHRRKHRRHPPPPPTRIR
ncbi:hypothetical protein Aperf_G00000042049 [Anoplocephala perfoliata]